MFVEAELDQLVKGAPSDRHSSRKDNWLRFPDDFERTDTWITLHLEMTQVCYSPIDPLWGIQFGGEVFPSSLEGILIYSEGLHSLGRFIDELKSEALSVPRTESIPDCQVSLN